MLGIDFLDTSNYFVKCELSKKLDITKRIIDKLISNNILIPVGWGISNSGRSMYFNNITMQEMKKMLKKTLRHQSEKN